MKRTFSFLSVCTIVVSMVSPLALNAASAAPSVVQHEQLLISFFNSDFFQERDREQAVAYHHLNNPTSPLQKDDLIHIYEELVKALPDGTSDDLKKSHLVVFFMTLVRNILTHPGMIFREEIALVEVLCNALKTTNNSLAQDSDWLPVMQGMDPGDILKASNVLMSALAKKKEGFPWLHHEDRRVYDDIVQAFMTAAEKDHLVLDKKDDLVQECGQMSHVCRLSAKDYGRAAQMLKDIFIGVEEDLEDVCVPGATLAAVFSARYKTSLGRCEAIDFLSGDSFGDSPFRPMLEKRAREIRTDVLFSLNCKVNARICVLKEILLNAPRTLTNQEFLKQTKSFYKETLKECGLGAGEEYSRGAYDVISVFFNSEKVCKGIEVLFRACSLSSLSAIKTELVDEGYNFIHGIASLFSRSSAEWRRLRVFPLFQKYFCEWHMDDKAERVDLLNAREAFFSGSKKYLDGGDVSMERVTQAYDAYRAAFDALQKCVQDDPVTPGLLKHDFIQWHMGESYRFNLESRTLDYENNCWGSALLRYSDCLYVSRQRAAESEEHLEPVRKRARRP